MSEPALTRPRGRVQALDLFRGLCILLMAAYHFTYDLVFYCGLPAALVVSPPAAAVQVLSSRGFILLAGVSSRLSRSNARRGCIVLAAGFLVEVVSALWGDPIRFGILQFMGGAMLIYAATGPVWRRLPGPALPILSLSAFVLCRLLLPAYTSLPFLYPFGLITHSFISSDYYPLFPWLFLFLLGTWLGGFLQEGKGPDALYRWRLPVLNAMGRHSLLIYLLHQPVLVVLAFGLSRLLA